MLRTRINLTSAQKDDWGPVSCRILQEEIETCCCRLGDVCYRWKGRGLVALSIDWTTRQPGEIWDINVPEPGRYGSGFW